MDNPELHESGWPFGPLTFGNEGARHAAAWRIAAELVRRNPEGLFILDAVPIAGVGYDCVRIARLDGRGYLDINRNATGSASRVLQGVEWDIWTELLVRWMSAPDRREYLHRIADWFEVPHPDRLPATTRRTLAYRAIAAWLQAHAMDRATWTARGAGLVDDLDAPLVRRELIAAFPGLEIPEPIGTGGPRRTAVEPAFSLWFLCRDDEPVAYVTVEGRIVGRSGRRADLFRAYARNHRLDDVVARMAAVMAD